MIDAARSVDDRDAAHRETIPATDLSRQMAAALTLMAQPMVNMAAMSALGVTLSTQAFGLWLGALSSRAPLPKLPEGGSSVRKVETETVAPTRLATVTKLSDAAPIRRAATRAAPAAKPQAAAPPEARASMRRPKATERPAVCDDLKAISGVGPKLEQVLNDLGIWTFAQVAGWSEAEIAWVDDRLGFGGRIGRDGWIGQAKRASRPAGGRRKP